ncbi:hypothetical protein ACPUER_33735 [Burkholderia sp. DN3021]|uniref:hypothetical protein n=1 Tax=Burkholderia sp. DN3021 TaxID=3410137 RepID=UPI003C7D78F9
MNRLAPQVPRQRASSSGVSTIGPQVRFDLADAVLLVLLLLSSIQFLKIGGAQLGQMFAVLVLPVLLVRRRIPVGAWEIWAFALFVGVALSTTFLSGYPRFKAAEQIVKFVFVMPAFYLIGRYYGARARTRPLPFGYVAIAAFLAFQYALQYFNVPVLYEKVDFMQNAVHGSFKERNWFAAFFFLTAYACFLQSRRHIPDVVKFVALALVVTLLSESKTVLIACGIVILLQVRGYFFAKVLTMAAGAAFYLYMFTRELTGDQLQVRLQQERGLAFTESIKLVGRDWIGHGFGFVEHYFSHSAVAVRGLGEGTSAVFCAPLDLMLVAGPIGLLAWAVFFAGLGQGRRAMVLLAPIAAWSLINPMHQSETTYLFVGYLASFAFVPRTARRKARAAPRVLRPRSIFPSGPTR